MSEELLRENLRELKLRYCTLRRERDDLMAANVLVSQEIDALKAENAKRLRTALEQIEIIAYCHFGPEWMRIQTIARAALEVTK